MYGGVCPGFFSVQQPPDEIPDILRGKSGAKVGKKYQTNNVENKQGPTTIESCRPCPYFKYGRETIKNRIKNERTG